MAQLEVEKRHLEFMRSVCKYDQDQEEGQSGGDGRSQEKSDPVVDLFPDDQDDERNSKDYFSTLHQITLYISI